MIEPIEFGAVRGGRFTVYCDGEFLTVRGLLFKRRVPMDRAIAVTWSPQIIWCSRRGRIRRTGVWFFGTGRAGADPSHGQREALVRWFERTLRQRLSGGRRSVSHLDNAGLSDQLRVAQWAAAWTKKHNSPVHASWARRLALLQAEVHLRAQGPR